MSERIVRPVVSPLREEIANPQPAGGLEGVGIFVLNIPLATKEKVSSWRMPSLRMPYISPLARGIGGVFLTIVTIFVGTQALQAIPASQERRNQATSTPDRRSPTITPRVGVTVGPEQRRPETSESRPTNIYTGLGYTGMTIGETGRFGFRNLIPGLRIAIDFSSLERLARDPRMGINKPENLGVFLYITNLDPDITNSYTDDMAHDDMRSARNPAPDIIVRRIGVQDPDVYRRAHNIGSSVSDLEAVRIGLTYEFAMRMREINLRQALGNPSGDITVPGLSTFTFMTILAEAPFRVDNVDPKQLIHEDLEEI